MYLTNDKHNVKRQICPTKASDGRQDEVCAVSWLKCKHSCVSEANVCSVLSFATFLSVWQCETQRVATEHKHNPRVPLCGAPVAFPVILKCLFVISAWFLFSIIIIKWLVTTNVEERREQMYNLFIKSTSSLCSRWFLQKHIQLFICKLIWKETKLYDMNKKCV